VKPPVTPESVDFERGVYGSACLTCNRAWAFADRPLCDCPREPGEPLYVQSVDKERGVIVYGPEPPKEAKQ